MIALDKPYTVHMSMRMATPPLRLRRPEAPAPFQMTRRHELILEALAQYRNLASDQIATIVGGSPVGVRRNLRNLFCHAYVDRPRAQHAQLANFFDEGNRPLVYALTRKGARYLAERGISLEHRLDHTFRRVTSPFLAHTIEVAQAMMQFGFACHGESGPKLIDHHELLPHMPDATRSARDPFKLAVGVTVGRERKSLELAVVPDRLFSLVFPARARSNFALELDRGTMDINAKRIVGKSSFRKKLIGYYNAWLNKKHTEIWGFESFRVLTITPSEKRLSNMLNAQREVTNDRAPGLFLYTTPERIAQQGPLGPVWVTSRSENVRLLPSTATEPTDA